MLSDEEVEEQIAFLDQKVQHFREEVLTAQNEIPLDLSDPAFALDLDHAQIIETDQGQRLATHGLTRKHRVRGDPLLVEDSQRSALQFGSYDFVILDESWRHIDRHQPFSLSFWLKPDDQDDLISIVTSARGKNENYKGFDVILENHELSFRLAHSLPFDLIEVAAADSLQPGEWIHVTWVYDGSSDATGIRLYLDHQPAEVTTKYNRLKRTIRDRGRPATRIGGTSNFSFDSGNTLCRIADLRLHLREIDRKTEPAALPLSDSLSRYRQRKYATQDTVLSVMVMEDRKEERSTFVLDRGQYDTPTEEVFPATPAALLAYPDEWPRNRLGLARWITHPENPLTARVLVNRLWQQFFGTGLVVTSEDFGNQGQLPSHPELLDWLAAEYINSGWDTKALIKKIVLSATYRQSSRVPAEARAVDPANRWLSRGPSYRMQAELIRDNALAASGLLVDEIGGESVKPYQPEGLWFEEKRL